MSRLTAQHELNLAKRYYSFTNLHTALKHAQNAVTQYNRICESPKQTMQDSYHLLDALTLTQSLLSLLHQPETYLSHEPLVKKLIYDIFPENGDVYYAIHLFDVCESMAVNNYLPEARANKDFAITLLSRLYGENPYIAFMQAYCDARIFFQTEDYYRCIESCQLVNTLWYTPEYGQVFPPFMERNPQNEAAIDSIGSNNILLLCNAYGKINNPEPAIETLEELLKQKVFQNYQAFSAEITLAQLYAIHQDYDSAADIYHKYANGLLPHYPDMTAALESLAYLLNKKPVLPIYTTNVQGYCYSHDALVTSRYNYALGLTAAGHYEQALAQFTQLGGKGYSMSLALLAQLNRTTVIASLKNDVDHYYYRQTNEILCHYNEELAYNHLSQLQYHIDLCLGAYCHCCTKDDFTVSPADAYSFLLNTKYLSLEVSYLQQTIERMQNRPLYSAEQVCHTLPKDTLLLEFTLMRNLETTHYGVFLISYNDVQYIPLTDSESIDSLLEQWHPLLQASITAMGKQADSIRIEQRNLDTKLRQTLFLPLKAYLSEYQQLIIAPAGAMVNFPFCRLSISAREYLGDRYNISYINTGKERCLKSPDINHIQNPFTADSTGSAPLIIGNPATTAYPPLPFADAEADMAAYFLHCKPYKGNEVTPEIFTNDHFISPSILHIAAHGVFHEFSEQREADWNQLYQAMTRSGIILSDDALLSLTHISTLDCSQTQLAVLSCCHSGQSSYQSTEGAYGLRRVFRLAGCRSLIVNLWQVDDAASFLWMQKFYETLTLTNCTIKEAFHHAVCAVRNYEKDGIRPFENPYYWAGHLLIQ